MLTAAEMFCPRNSELRRFLVDRSSGVSSRQREGGSFGYRNADNNKPASLSSGSAWSSAHVTKFDSSFDDSSLSAVVFRSVWVDSSFDSSLSAVVIRFPFG